MVNIELNFTDNEIAVIQLFAPGKGVEEILNIVLRDWYTVNSDRMYKKLKPQDEIAAEIISLSGQVEKSAQESVPEAETPA